MIKHFAYADEAGCFTFNRNRNVSTYFIIVTVVMPDWQAPTFGLQQLRHDLLMKGAPVNDYFHATTDAQVIRDAVYENIVQYEYSVQATICEKAKAQPQITSSKARFYKTPWYYHCKIGLAPLFRDADEVIITAASLGTKKERLTFTNALGDVMRQNLGGKRHAVDFRPCQADPCLQIADYCAWAIQRKWERGDERSYDLIKNRITREFDLWEHGKHRFY